MDHGGDYYRGSESSEGTEKDSRGKSILMEGKSKKRNESWRVKLSM